VLRSRVKVGLGSVTGAQMSAMVLSRGTNVRGGGKCPAFGRHSIADRLTDRQRLYRQNVNAVTVIPGEKLRALNQLVAKRSFHGSPLHQLVYSN